MTDSTALRTMTLGLLETASVVAGVLAFGLLWAALGARLAAASAYPLAGSGAASGEQDVRWLVDGFNVLHAGVLRGNDRQGWWREEMRARLLARVTGFDDETAELWVVFDGSGPPAESELRSARPRVVFAPSADEWLLAEVREAEDPSSVVVVTADRQLADRARHRGAQVMSPRAFLARCTP